MTKRANRSAAYQHLFAESLCSHEMLADFANSEGLTSSNSPYNDELQNLKDKLKIELWKLIDTELTPRQREVIRLYAQGYTQIEIAKMLQVNQSSITKSINGNCLIATTNISTNNGLIAIENIQENDLVLTRYGYKKVTAILPIAYKKVFQLNTRDGKVLTGTADHPIFVDGIWISLSELKNGFELTCVSPAYNEIEIDFVKETYELDGEQRVYNFSVEDSPEYFANGILTHNCDYKAGKRVYGGAKKKLRKLAEKDEAIQSIMRRISEIESEFEP